MGDAPTNVIELLVAPAVIIPACGLLVLSISARMNAVIARIRLMHTERIEMYLREDSSDPRLERVRAMRLDGLESQTDRMLRRCQLMQRSIRLLYCAVICLVLTSLLLGLSVFVPSLLQAAAALFGLGMIGVLVAMAIEFVEIGMATDAVTYEHGRVVALCHSCDAGEQKEDG